MARAREGWGRENTDGWVIKVQSSRFKKFVSIMYHFCFLHTISIEGAIFANEIRLPRGLIFPFFASILVPFLPKSSIFLSRSLFFLIFLEKSSSNVWSVRKKVVPLHSLSARGAQKLDLWQTANRIQDKQRADTLYNIYGCCAQATKSFLLYEET